MAIFDVSAGHSMVGCDFSGEESLDDEFELTCLLANQDDK